mgnify:CR=1 FL=1
MDIYLTIAIIIANIIAISITYQFIKKMSKKEIVLFLAISVAVMYILVSITYWISGFGIDSTVHEAMKNFVTYLFVPINVILFIPYFASQYRKFKNKKIKVQELSRKLSALVILLIVILVIEYFYFVNVQKNIKNMEQNQTNTIVQNEQTTEINNNEGIINVVNANEVQTNKVTANQI